MSRYQKEELMEHCKLLFFSFFISFHLHLESKKKEAKKNKKQTHDHCSFKIQLLKLLKTPPFNWQNGIISVVAFSLNLFGPACLSLTWVLAWSGQAWPVLLRVLLFVHYLQWEGHFVCIKLTKIDKINPALQTDLKIYITELGEEDQLRVIILRKKQNKIFLVECLAMILSGRSRWINP